MPEQNIPNTPAVQKQNANGNQQSSKEKDPYKNHWCAFLAIFGFAIVVFILNGCGREETPESGENCYETGSGETVCYNY
jgi:hypothetical protein